MKRSIAIVLFSAVVSLGFAQTITLSTGVVQSSTVWRMEQDRFAAANYGLNYFQVPKSDISVSLGLEYLEKEKWSVSNYISYYQSGGKLAVNEGPESNPAFRWDLEDDIYDLPYVAVNTNINLKLFQQNKTSLEGIVGIHLDYVLATENKALDLHYDRVDPLWYMNEREALNRLNGGVNVGARYAINLEKWKLGLQYIYAPKILKLAHYDFEESGKPFDNNISAFTVTEKASFIELTFGYKLKK